MSVSPKLKKRWIVCSPISKMIEVTDRKLERELQHPPPRRVRFSGHAVLLCMAASLLLVAFGACGVAAILEASRLQILQSHGRLTTATVVKVEYSNGAVPTGFLYRFTTREHRSVVARFPISNARSGIDGRAPKAPALLAGAKFPLLYAVIGGRLIGRPAESTSQGKVLSLAFVGLASASIGLWLFMQCIGWLMRARKLVKHGNVVVGTVLGKEAAVEESARYFISVTFTDPDGVVHLRKVPCSATQYQTFHAGQSLSIVYPADRPAEAMPYALLPFGH